ncbi:uncharacterized protein [Drosophila pseudoobscura]|uniref:Uncharacterized protein n=1 Tax=Drosophila pseudoobscura pseudoobscura TaxID=46245 RepID=A0A6I8V2T6_DROPS|nr:uncharacterized protein LOC6897346 [Drosophila pseudoobscura]
MLPKVSLLLLSCVLLSAYASGHQELDNLLMQQQKDLQLSSSEVEALRPLYRELQSQYDYLYSLKLQQGDGSAQSEAVTEPQMDASYLQVFEELRSQFSIYVDEKPKIVYDTSLPTVEELIGKPSPDLTKEQQAEFEDLRDILQDVIDEAQEGIDELVMRAIDLETNLLTINKPKIVTAAIGGLGFMSKYWGFAEMAAYCSYSHVPQFKQALQAVSDGVDCYTYTTVLVLRIQHETVASVKEIRQSIRGLVNIYKKIAAKQTTMGRILSGTINALSAIRRVHDIIAVGIEGYGKLNNELPGAALKSAQCGVEFVNSIPQMVETTQNLTACIVYVDTDKPSYEFTLPEEDRYWNTGAEPPEIPYENSGDEDDEDEDLENVDDYVDHR